MDYYFNLRDDGNGVRCHVERYGDWQNPWSFADCKVFFPLNLKGYTYQHGKEITMEAAHRAKKYIDEYGIDDSSMVNLSFCFEDLGKKYGLIKELRKMGLCWLI